MISAVMPGTVGFAQGSAADTPVPDGPMPAPPEVALAVGEDVVHSAGLDPVVVPGDGVPVVPVPVVPIGPVGAVPLAVVPADAGAAPPPPLLALAPEAPASARTAKPGSIRCATRKSLFRRPAGLADGLALKEPAPPADSPRDSPQGTGSPAPRMLGPADSASRQYTCCRGAR